MVAEVRTCDCSLEAACYLANCETSIRTSRESFWLGLTNHVPSMDEKPLTR